MSNFSQFISSQLNNVPLAGQTETEWSVPSQKRAFGRTIDLVDEISARVSSKRFRGSEIADQLKAALPDQLASGLTVVNTGLSTTDAQSDEIFTQAVISKPYKEGWHNHFTEYTALFCNRTEPDSTTKGQIYTVADVPILNFFLDLNSVRNKTNSIVQRGQLSARLNTYLDNFDHIVADSAQDFANKWNLLGPMTLPDKTNWGPNSSKYGPIGNQRLLAYSVFNRAQTFNLFSENVRLGDSLYFVVTKRDVSHMKHIVDPVGNMIATRASYPSEALQIVGFTDKSAPIPFHNTNYDEENNPRKYDLDYIEREQYMLQDWKQFTVEEDEKGRELLKVTTEPDSEAVPEVVYRAYMEGHCKRLGVARFLHGHSPTAYEIEQGLRSENQMKLLQIVEFYNRF